MMHHEERRAKASSILSKHGYGKMKDIADHEIGKAVSQHDKQKHGGSKTKLHLATGGCATGGEPHSRLDRKPRAAGGRNKGHKEPHVAVNVINAGGKQPMPMPMAGAMPPHPPMAPPPQAQPPMAPQRPPMMPPQGAMPQGGMRPPGMMAAGGRAKRAAGGPVPMKGSDVPHLTGGGGGALGRLEKSAHEKSRSKAA